MGRWGGVLLSAALVAALSGCGSRAAPGPVAQDSAEVAAQSTPVPDPGGRAGVAAPGSSVPMGEAGAAKDGGTDGDEQPPPGAMMSQPPLNDGTVTITLSAQCVRIGDVLTVTIVGPPKGGLGAVVAFADHQAHGAMATGETDANGRYVWRVPIEPTVPEGKATAIATVSGPKWAQEGGGRATRDFHVAGLAGC